LLGEGPVTGFSTQGHFNRGSRCEVSDFVHNILIFMLKENLTHIEVTVDEPRIVSEVHTLGELDSNIVDGLDVAAGHIDSQVKVQTLDILEDVAAIVRFHH